MDKELLGTFEAASKAADAAAAGGGAAEVDRCLDALRQLRKMHVTMNDLVTTQVGKRLRPIAKHSNGSIRAVASDLLEFWKNVVIEETNGKNKKSTVSEVEPAKAVKVKSEFKEEALNTVKKAGTVSAASHSIKTENGVKPIKNEATRVGSTPADEKPAGSAKKPVLATRGPPKLTSMVRCNDSLRDKIRELLAEAFSNVSSEAAADSRDEVRNILDEVDACDPIHMAVTVESAMFEKLGRSNGAQKLKYRSLMFNLKDAKNPDLRRRVLLGRIRPEGLIDMSPEEMASDERKLSNKQIKDKALFECERGGAPKATTDQFKCGKCGQRKCTYYQLQTRSADEPMTTFVTCVNCNNHWKFC